MFRKPFKNIFKKLVTIFFSFVVPPVRLFIAFYIFPPPFPLSFFLPVFPFIHGLPARGPPPLENVTAAILSYTISHSHEGHGKTAENLCRCSRTFHRFCPQSTVSEKMTSRSAFQYAGRGPSKYWLSAKLHHLCDRLVPDTYYPPNAVDN